MRQRLLLGGVVAALCGSLVTLAAPVDAQRDTPGSATGRLTMMDARFVHAAALGNMMEIDLGELAQDKATRADVKAFATRMVQDHTKSHQDLRALATQKGISLPPMMPDGDRRGEGPGNSPNASNAAQGDRNAPGAVGAPDPAGAGRADLARFGLRHMVVEHQELRRMLASLSGEDFDKAYIASQVKAHSKMAPAYEMKSRDAADSDLRKFAGNKLPVILEHKSMARRLAGLGTDSDRTPRR